MTLMILFNEITPCIYWTMFIPYEEYKIYLHDEKKLNSLLSNKKKNWPSINSF